jgi:hypothetical protein
MSSFVRVERHRQRLAAVQTHQGQRSLVLVATACAVFALAFAAGRVTSSAGVSAVQPAPELPVAPAGATVPLGLGFAAPIELPPASRPRQGAATATQASAAPPATPTPAVSPAPTSVPVAPAPTRSPAPASAPVAPRAPSARPAPSAPQRAPGGGSSGGGSFESSG